MSSWQFQLEQLLNLVTSPMGFALLMGGVVFVILSITRESFRYLAVAVMLWSTLLTLPTVVDFKTQLIQPLNLLRDYSRSVTAGMALVLLLPALLAKQGVRQNVFSAPMVAMLVFHLMISLLEAFSGGGYVKPALSVLVISSIFIVFSFGAGKWLQSMTDAHRLLAAVGICALIFVGTTTVQGMINSNAIKWSGRLFATTANPQFAAAAFALLFPTVAYLALQKQTNKIFRFMYFGTMGLLVVYIGWTGSRTGMLMAAVGLLVLFRLRLGKAFIAVAGASTVFIIGYMVFGDEAEATDRLFTMQDTRTHVWKSMLSSFQRNPLFGAAGREIADFRGSENSYLLTAAKYGLAGLLPLLILTGLVLREVLFLLMNRGALHRMNPTAGLLGDLTCGTLLSIGAGSLFEGYLISQFSLPVYVSMIFLAMSLYLREYLRGATAYDYMLTPYSPPQQLQQMHYAPPMASPQTPPPSFGQPAPSGL